MLLVLSRAAPCLRVSAVVRGGKVVEWKDAAWRAINTISANQANNIKKQRQSTDKKEFE